MKKRKTNQKQQKTHHKDKDEKDKPKQERIPYTNSASINKSSINDFLILKPELIGFQITFLLMLVLPVIGFFIAKCIFKLNIIVAVFISLQFDSRKVNTYSFIASVIIVWTIMMSYSIYYVKDEIKLVFCNKRKEKQN